LVIYIKHRKKNICDLGVDCGGKAVDSVRLVAKFQRNTKGLTLFDAHSRLFWYSINKKTRDQARDESFDH
jgi:hypothetical protein